MLQDIRDKLKAWRWLGIFMLGVLIVIFAAWGSYGVVDLSFGTPSYAAKVNGEEVPLTAVQQAWQQRQSQYQQQLKADIPLEQRRLLQQQVMDEYIDRTLLRQRAQQRGMHVDDAAVGSAYQSEAAFQVDGKFSEQVARGVLLQSGLTPAGYEAQLRNQLQSAQLLQAIQATGFLTETELQHIFALENEQRELRFALLPGTRFEAAVPIDQGRLQAWYDAHPDDYQSAESVRLQYAELRLDGLADAVTVDEADLQKWYEANKARYVEEEQRHARHVLIAVPENADAAARAAALKKAQDVAAQARAGKDFAALARQYSDDTGSKGSGGDLGWLRAGASIDKNFSAALFAMKTGAVSDNPVKTQFGYHVIKLEEIQGTAGKSLADARPQIETDYKRERASELFGDRQEQLQQKLERGGSSDLAALAKEFGLQTGEAAKYTRSGGAPLGNNADLNEVVFSADVVNGGRIGGPVALGTDRLVIVKVLEHVPARARPLAEVLDEVVAAVRKEGGSVAARKAADEAVKQLAGGADLNAVLKTLGVSATAPRLVGRGDPQLPVQVRDAAFALPFTAGKSSYKSVPLEDGGAAILAVSQVKPGTSGANAANDQQQAGQWLKREREGESAAYQLEMRARATVKRNDATFN